MNASKRPGATLVRSTVPLSVLFALISAGCGGGSDSSSAVVSSSSSSVASSSSVSSSSSSVSSSSSSSVSSSSSSSSVSSSSSSSSSAAVTYTLGGTVSGLATTTTGLVLRNGTTNLTIPAAATTFTFGSILSVGTAYSVTVQTQPTGYTCAVTNGAGTAGAANVSNVAVACTAQTFTVGGTITGLNTAGLVLKDVSGTAATVDTKTVAAAATTFTFTTPVAFGAAYAVTVQTQPAGLTCAVTGGTGTIATAANVTTVAVACTAPASAGWTWVNGTNGLYGSAVYGIKGTADPANSPGARYKAAAFKDPSGNLWLFGGDAGSNVEKDDLWKFTPSVTAGVQGGQWTWVAGSQNSGVTAVLGTQGTAAAANTPGSLIEPATWTDASGNFWLFGGSTHNTSSTAGTNEDYHDELWMFSPTTSQWTWIGGYQATNLWGLYGTQGTGDSANIPGSRRGAETWVDSAGNLWLFGGVGIDSVVNSVNPAAGPLNDLWKYEIATKKWTWVSGSSTLAAVANYGVQGTAAASNVPSARQLAGSWTDYAGNLWLFGGYGPGTTSTTGFLGDLWKFTPATNTSASTTGQWTWVSGFNSLNPPGVYGTQGTAAASNAPGGRDAFVTWTDAAGSLWLFGGAGQDSTSASSTTPVYLNDLWKFVPSTGLWTWVKGGTTTGVGSQVGVYGTQGTAAAANTPGGRDTPVSWFDGTGGLWLYGGESIPSSPNLGLSNDLWKY